MDSTLFTRFSFAALVTALVLTGCGDTNAEKNSGTTAEEQAVPVSVVTISTQSFVETLHLSGTIKAIDDITISPEEGGVVERWHAAKGEFVRKGDIIISLKDDVAKASYDAAQAQFESAELTYQKQKTVYAEQAISEWQLKTAEYARDAAKAQAHLMRSRWERTRITSPVSGLLDARYVEIGEMAPPAVPIARVVSINSVKVSINVPERYAGTIKRGTPLKLTVLAHPHDEFTGRISFVGAAISPDNRTFPVESVIPNTGLKLKPEMIAKVQLEQSENSRALLVDESAVQLVDRNRQIVYVANNGKAEERAVELGGRKGNLVQIVQGVNEGEKIIIRGQKELVDGQKISIVNK